MTTKRVKNQRDGKARKSPVNAGISNLRTLWKANLRIGERKDSFLFRANEEFAEASLIAEMILQTSPAATMFGAVIVGIERQARLWN